MPGVDATGIDAHDRQRVLTAEASADLLEVLVPRLSGPGPVLDAGVGSGRMALPLVAAGLPVVGADLSRPMLAALVDTAAATGVPRPPLVEADMVSLPFGDGVFAGVHLSNVLHHVAGWRTALAELVRVTRPGGSLLLNLGTGRRADEGLLRGRILGRAGRRLAERRRGVRPAQRRGRR